VQYRKNTKIDLNNLTLTILEHYAISKATLLSLKFALSDALKLDTHTLCLLIFTL